MKILITRPRAQADDFADKLRKAGFEPIFFPVIEIQPIENNVALERALEKLNSYEWAIFTSVNAVEVVFDRLPSPCPLPNGEGKVTRQYESPSPHGRGVGVRVAAIGPKTAEALRKHGIKPDFIPNEYVSEAIMSGLGDVQDKWILLPRAEIARNELPETISKAGGIVHEIVVYKTLPAEIDMDGLNALKSGVDIVTFTSASTVENFAAVCKQNRLDPLSLPNNPLFACIGPVTEQAAREAGFANLVVAKEYTTDGLIGAFGKLVH